MRRFDRKILDGSFADKFEQWLICVFSISQRMIAAIQCAGKNIPALALCASVAGTDGFPIFIKCNVFCENQIGVSEIISTFDISAQFLQIRLTGKLPGGGLCAGTGKLDCVRAAGAVFVNIYVYRNACCFVEVSKFAKIIERYAAIPCLSTDCVIRAGLIARQRGWHAVIQRAPVIMDPYRSIFDQFCKMRFVCNSYCKRSYIRITLLIIKAFFVFSK